jgi:hypothetical protein
MQTITTLLDQAEETWRDQVSRDHPLWSDISVEKKGKPQPERDWFFATDLKKISALIFRDEELQRKFREVVPQYWDGEPEELARDTLHYLLYHELYHPLEAPSSKDDNKRTHQAIRRGLLKAEPTLSPLEQVLKVSSSQNGVKDFILDNRFAVDNAEEGYVRGDVIPIWDLLELDGKPSKTDFYTITRFLYGSLYGPEKADAFFRKKAGKKGVSVGVDALHALLKKETDRSLVARIKRTLSTATLPERDSLVKDIRTIFAGEDRYAGIERFMEVLGPNVQTGKPSGRCDYQGEGSGASPQDILGDLLDGMAPEEQQAFLGDLAGQLNNPKSGSYFSQGEEDSVTSWDPSKDEQNKLELSTLHEFYKRNSPEVIVVGGGKEGQTVEIGKKQRFVLRNTTVIREDELSKLNLARIARFQKRTRLPVLIPLDNGLFRVNEYDVKEDVMRDTVYVDKSLDVPDEVEFYVDSSGSMYAGTENHGFNDGSRWDMLSNALYGYVKALYDASRELKKPCSIKIHNFGNRQVSSRPIPVAEFWEQGPQDVLQPLFKPENGYNVEDINIDVKNDGKKRTYVIVTDGELVIEGRTQRESQKMKQLAKQPNTDVVLFEIGGTYGLGNAVRSNPAIHYQPVHDKGKMLQYGLEVLLGK